MNLLTVLAKIGGGEILNLSIPCLFSIALLLFSIALSQFIEKNETKARKYTYEDSVSPGK